MQEERTSDNAQLWANYWEASTRKEKGHGPMQAAFWNTLSHRFKKEHSSEKDDERVKGILELINRTGLEISGATVLDIGAGMGSLSIPLAKKGAIVTVLDFSSEMLKHLKERADNEGAPISRIIQRSWDEVNLDTERLRGQFDLVIASMTPAVRDPLTFGMMMAASRRICYYSGWVNRRWDQAYADLHRILFNREFTEGVHGIFLPFMYLYLLGYRPEIVLKEEAWERETPIGEMVDMVSSHFYGTVDTDPDVRARMSDYFTTRGSEGRYTERSTSTSAMMVWDIQNRIFEKKR